MARYRTVKPELYSDEKLCEVSRGSRLLFIGLLNFADDMGRKAYAPKRIKMEIFLGDEDVAPKQVSVWIHQLEQAHVLKSMKWTDTPTSGFQLSSHIRKSISPDIPPILGILKTLIPTVNASNAKKRDGARVFSETSIRRALDESLKKVQQFVEYSSNSRRPVGILTVLLFLASSSERAEAPRFSINAIRRQHCKEGIMVGVAVIVPNPHRDPCRVEQASKAH